MLTFNPFYAENRKSKLFVGKNHKDFIAIGGLRDNMIINISEQVIEEIR